MIKIDFLELQVLIEASWHAGTILRHSILQKAINQWHGELNAAQRKKIFDFFDRVKADDCNLEIQQKFMARYNPEQQYIVIASPDNNNIRHSIEAFEFNGLYYTTSEISINPKAIIEVEPLK